MTEPWCNHGCTRDALIICSDHPAQTLQTSLLPPGRKHGEAVSRGCLHTIQFVYIAVNPTVCAGFIVSATVCPQFMAG